MTDFTVYDYWQVGVHRGENGMHMLCLANLLSMMADYHTTLEQIAHAKHMRTLDFKLYRGRAPRIFDYIQLARVRYPTSKEERTHAHYHMGMDGYYSYILREDTNQHVL